MIFISPFKKNLVKYAFYIALLSMAFIVFSLPHLLVQNYKTIPIKDTRFPTDLKYILFWRPSKDKKSGFRHYNQQQLPTGQTAFIEQKCQFINCYITYDKRLLRQDHRNFDSVVFNVHNVMKLRPSDMNLTRSYNQIYIFHSLQSSENHAVCNRDFDGFFNWTWTYKLDSDVSHPFFNIHDVNHQLVGPAKDIKWITAMKHGLRFTERIRKKSKAVALLIDKCSIKIKYQGFIKEFHQELQGYNYSLDLIGPCGDTKCSNNQLSDCHKLIERKYFFELVLEDSIAIDYVTEKLEKAMTHLVIPIVLGGLDYTSFMPPGSYIDFQQLNMKKIGAIIDYLIKNPATYAYLYDWKNHYYYTPKSRFFLCDLCAKLNSNDSVYHKSYTRFREWWNPNYKDACRKLGYKH